MNYRETTLPIEKRVASLLKEMTLPEKIAQMGSCWFEELTTAGKFDDEKAKARLQPGIGQVTRVVVIPSNHRQKLPVLPTGFKNFL